MIRCPKCGHENPDNTTNCAKCHVNLQYALANLEQLQAQWQGEKESAAFAEQNAKKIEGLAKKIEGLLVTTTPIIQGKIITEYLGIVSSVAVLGTGFLSELGGSVADLFGTRASGFQDKLNRAREIVLQEVKEQAVQRGSDAIVGLDLDYMTLAANMLMVSANGTAVKLSLQVEEDSK